MPAVVFAIPKGGSGKTTSAIVFGGPDCWDCWDFWPLRFELLPAFAIPTVASTAVIANAAVKAAMIERFMG